MKRASSAKERPWKGVGKKLVSIAASTTLALSLAPAAAFAQVSSADVSDDWYALPQSTSGVSVQASNAGVNGDSGWFKLPGSQITNFTNNGKTYLSSGVERVVGGFSQSMYYIMGINGVNFDRGLRNNDPLSKVSGSEPNRILTVDAVTAVDGIMGTEVNENPDQYLWNSCYRMYKNQKFQSVASEADLEVHINQSNVSNYETVAVTVQGTEYAMPVPIYHEANFISNTDSEWTTSKSVATWAKIENAREGRHSTAIYDPYIGTWTTNSGGIDFGCELMYKLAAAMDAVASSSNNAVTSRYVDSSKAATNAAYYSSATALATDYEMFAKATQWDMMRQLAAGVEEKTVAVICGYQPATGSYPEAYACAIFNPEGIDTHNSADYGGRLVNSVKNISKDVNEVLQQNNVPVAFAAKSNVAITSNGKTTTYDETKRVGWYKPADIAKYADAIFVCDCPVGNNRAVYLATNASGNQSSVYSVDNKSYTKENDHVNGLISAQTEQNKTGKKVDLFYKYPSHLFGVWYAQGFENNWLGPIAAAQLYSGSTNSTFPSVETVMGYAAKKFWHITDADLTNVLNATCADISMPVSNSKFDASKVTAQSCVSAMNAVIKSGKDYYNGAGNATLKEANKGDLVAIDATKLANKTNAAYSPTVIQSTKDAVQPVTVTFDADNGTTKTTQILDKGTKATKPADPTRTGYTFKGWYNGTTAFNFDTAIDSDITLTAKWSGNGLAKGKSATVGSGAKACKVKATSSTAVTYVAPKSKSTKKVTVPATVKVNGKTYKVTAIKANAFKGSKATSITVGKNVKSIVAKTFNGAKKLTSVKLGAGVKALKKGAFKGAPKLIKVTITSKSLKTKASVKNAFKGSKVKTVVLKGMTAKQKKAVKNTIVKYGGKASITVK